MTPGFTRLRRACSALVGVALLSACSGTLVGPATDSPNAFNIRLESGARFQQQLTLNATTLHTGDTLTIRSRLENIGDSAATVSYTICGLHLRAELEWHDPFPHCLALAGPLEMKPGDSVEDGAGLVIDSGPGSYRIEVQQVFDPEVWVPVTITVIGD